MKDSGKYAKKVVRLFSSLKKANPAPKEPEYPDPVDSVVFGILSEHITYKDAKSAMRKIKSHFVDLNDLRVSRAEEIVDVLGLEKESGLKVAADITKVLNVVFDRYDSISLETLMEVGKRQAKKELEELECISPFAIGYCFLTSLKGHAIPLTESMVAYFHDNELVHSGAAADVIEGFLERQINSSEGYAFYQLIREESEKTTSRTRTTAKTAAETKTAAGKTTAKKKTAAKKTVKKKTAKKKTTTKKKTTAKRNSK